MPHLRASENHYAHQVANETHKGHRIGNDPVKNELNKIVYSTCW